MAHRETATDDQARTVTATAATPETQRRRLRRLQWLAVVSWLAYGGVAWLSGEFLFGERFQTRPIVEVLIALAVAFATYLAAVATAVRCRPSRQLFWTIALAAGVFRLTLLPTQPIQEIDIYRYIWDGAVAAEGVSPFRYSPAQVLAALAHPPHRGEIPAERVGSVLICSAAVSAAHCRRDACTTNAKNPGKPGHYHCESSSDALPADLARLAALCDREPAVAEALAWVHFGELPTVYLPVSQAVFALAARVTPREAPLTQRLVVMKAAFLFFDLATFGLVVGLLRRSGRHIGWSLAYGWCPLVLKEFANSGHLDSIAVALTTAAAYAAVRAIQAREEQGGGLGWLLAAGVLLALAIGAKLYPLILAPLLVATAWRRWGYRAALFAASILAGSTLLVLWPMLPRGGDWSIEPTKPVVEAITPEGNDSSFPPSPPSEHGTDCEPPTEPFVTEPQDPSLGLRAFFGRWEMNDFVFLLLIENVKLDADTPANEGPWFSVVPQAWRAWLLTPLINAYGLAPKAAAFLLARVLTATAFVALSLCLAWRGSKSTNATTWLRAGFLTLAWFWLLSPTQTPWYWTWALPFIPFARGRAWLAVSGLSLLYYLRFWFGYQWPETAVAGTGYHGTLFFDFVVTWIEFGPWIVWLLAASAIGFRRRKPCERGSSPVTL